MDNPRHDRGAIPTSTRLMILCAALGLMAALGVDLAAHLRTPGYRAARAIQAGYARAATLDADAAADEALAGGDNEAGYRWAERRSLDRAADCAPFTPAFRQGCEAYVREQAR